MLSIRKIGVIGRTYRNLNRYRHILTVLFKYGFGDLIERMRIDQYIEIGLQMISRKRRERLDKLSRAERVRMALTELGPTYIKLGQILSTRPDLIPVDFVHELSKLQDDVPPFGYDEVVRIITAEMGGTPETIFAEFDAEPLGSASLGQVHPAVLAEGEKVVVKIQRPGIRKLIEVDLEIMLHLATLTERHIEEFALQRPVKIVEEFARSLEREINYTTEATNMERMASLFMAAPHLYIPKVYREFSTERVLTMEYIDGIKVSDVGRLCAQGLDCKIINARGADFMLRQVFDFGFFHADPHPGNIFVLPDNVICLIDFGMVGTIDQTMRDHFVDLIDHVVHRREQHTMRVLLRFTEWDHEPNLRLLEKDVADFMGQHLYKPLKEIEIGKLLQNLLELAGRHQMRIPPDIFLMLKALATVEGVALALDPEFDMIAAAAPFISRLKMERYSPQRISADLLRYGAELVHFIQYFPGDVLEITRMIKQRKLAIQFEHQGLEGMIDTLNQISNKLSFAIIIAALLIGSALIVFAKTPPLFYGLSVIGIIGFIAAAVMGLWLLIAMLKRGRL